MTIKISQHTTIAFPENNDYSRCYCCCGSHCQIGTVERAFNSNDNNNNYGNNDDAIYYNSLGGDGEMAAQATESAIYVIYFYR